MDEFKERDSDTGDQEAGEQQGDLSSDLIDQVKVWSDQAEEARKEGRQLGLGIPDEDEVSEEDLTATVIASQQNPDESHRLYYAIQRILKNDLPPGEGDNEKLRRAVYDEKNLYINRGEDLDERGIRGSDGRMGYLPHLRVALSLVKKWRAETGSAFDIFLAFWEVNEQLGYHQASPKGQPKKAQREKPLKIKGTLGDVLNAAMSEGKSKENQDDRPSE